MLLSVCIPTHDGRVDTLRAALESILDQIEPALVDQIEVCISDNASRDGTEEMVGGLRSAARIRYRREPIDRGPPTNIRRSLELASGRWCWLLGSDDAIAPGGLHRALELCAAYPDVAGITVYRTAYDRDLSSPLAVEPHPEIFPAAGPSLERLTGADQIFGTVGLPMTFMSSQIVDRDGLMRAVARVEATADGHRWLPQMAWIVAMIAERPDWVVCREPLAWQRTGNAELGVAGGSLVALQVGVASDLWRLWRTIPAVRRSTRRTLLERWRREVARPPMIAAYRAHPNHGPGDELRMVVGFTGLFGRLPAFWRDTAPALLWRR